MYNLSEENSALTCPYLKEYVLQFRSSYVLGKTFVMSFVVVNALVSVVASSSNFAVIYTILKTPSLRTPPNVLILGLAVSDFGVGVVSQPAWYLLAIFEWQKIFIPYCAAALVANTSSWLFSTMSFLTLTFITLDRYLALRLHLRYQELVTTKRYTITLGFILFVGSLAAILRVCVGNKAVYTVAFIVLLTLITLNVYLIFKISRVIHRHSVQIQTQQQSIQQSINMPGYKVSVNTMFYVIGAFVLCYFPYVIGLMAIGVLKEWTLEMKYLFSATITFLMLNGVFNPFIYCWRIEDIRSNANRLMRGICKCREVQVP